MRGVAGVEVRGEQAREGLQLATCWAVGDGWGLQGSGEWGAC